MAVEYTTTKDKKLPINVLVYGRSGIGKTWLIPTCPKPIIISTESGLLSIAGDDFPEIPVIKVSTLEDLKVAFKTVKKNKGKFKTVCLDSITDIAEAILSHLKKNTKHGAAAYGKLNEEIGDLIRDFRDLPMDSYFIAQLAYKENAAGIECARPAMPGNTLRNQLPYFFDEVLCLRFSGDEEEDDEEDTTSYRYFQTAPDLAYDAKDRSGALDAMEEPDMKKIFKKIRKRIKGN